MQFYTWTSLKGLKGLALCQREKCNMQAMTKLCVSKFLWVIQLTVCKRNHVFNDEQVKNSQLLIFKMNNPSWRHCLKERRGFISTAFIYLWCAVHMSATLVVNMFWKHWTRCRNPKSTSVRNTWPKDHQGFRHYVIDWKLPLAVVVIIDLFDDS